MVSPGRRAGTRVPSATSCERWKRGAAGDIRDCLKGEKGQEDDPTNAKAISFVWLRLPIARRFLSLGYPLDSHSAFEIGKSSRTTLIPTAATLVRATSLTTHQVAHRAARKSSSTRASGWAKADTIFTVPQTGLGSTSLKKSWTT